MAYCEQEFDLTIRDINSNLELSNKGILSFFEDIGGFQSNEAGLGIKDIEQTRLSWILLHWKIKVLKNLKYDGNPVKVRTWSRGIKRACCMRDFELYDSNNELCVIGTSKWTLIHFDKGLVRLTDDLVHKYVYDSKSVFGDDFEFKKLIEPDNYSSIYEYIVSRRDIDINNHMHNTYYLDLAYDALPKDIYENNSFNNFEIMYKNAALLGEKLKCFYSFVDGEHFVTIKNEDESKLHAIIKLY